MLFVDGTLGAGGHAAAILEQISPDGMFLGIDWDKKAAEQAKKRLMLVIQEQRLKVTLRIAAGNFGEIRDIVAQKAGKRANALLLDLGFSSDQLVSGKGFSFNRDEPLIMRYDGNIAGLTAARVLGESNEHRLAAILEQYGEEKFAKRIAKGIVKARKVKPLRTTFELVDAIRTSLPHGYRPKLHSATRTFLALRLFVNEELKNLERALKSIPDVMARDGRMAIISFHSLEDRIVKQQFRELAKNNKVRLITKKPIVPTDDEIAGNPRSRSAKLRAIQLK